MTLAVSSSVRAARVRQALFHGDKLTLDHPRYLRTLEAIAGTLFQEDREPRDATAAALGLDSPSRMSARIVTKESGVAAGLKEAQWLAARGGVEARAISHDGDALRPGDALLVLEGAAAQLLGIERVCLNILQRMCGIASATRRWQEIVEAKSDSTFVAATRKTPWGLLDKRAVHCGGGATHRLGLGDAILIKNNHLALLDGREETAVSMALDRAWPRRADAAFVEVEVRSLESARIAAVAFSQFAAQEAAPPCPCIIMLDNMTPAETARVVADLEANKLRQSALLESSGNIDERTIAAYAAAGVDAISSGALTHSARALDLHQKLIE